MIEHAVDIQLESAVVPTTAYNVHSKNNSFTVTKGSTTRVITFPPQNYTEESFLQFLKCELEQEFEITLTVSHDSKLAFHCDSSFSFTFQEHDLHNFLGFSYGTYSSTASPTDSSKQFLSATSRYSVYDAKYLFIKIDELDEIVLCAPITDVDNKGRMCKYVDPSHKQPPIKAAFGPVLLTKLHFRIEDENGHSYDTNGVETTLVLRITQQIM